MKSILYSSLIVVGLLFLFACNKKATYSFLNGNEIIVDPAAPPPLTVRTDPCRAITNYIPDTNRLEHMPMRWVRVNAHIIDREDGQHNFPDPLGREFVRLLIEMANKRLASNVKMHLPPNNDTPVLPTRYRFKLVGSEDDPNDDGIYFHRDNELYFINKKDRRGANSIFAKKPFDVVGKRKNEVINILFLEHHKDSIPSPTYKASGDGAGTAKWVKMVGSYNNWKDNEGKISLAELANGMAALFNHELGHSLGLAHTWIGNDGCDDTPPNNNCWNIDPNSEQCNSMDKISNNVMDYNAWQAAFTPCQIGKIHKKLSTKSSVRKMLEPTWCTYQSDKSVRIRNGQNITWAGAKDLEGDLIIKKGATLTAQCVISLPAKAKILVEAGGKLVLDGATLTNRCQEDQKWEGIEIQQKGNQRGVVEMYREAVIDRVVNEVKISIEGRDTQREINKKTKPQGKTKPPVEELR